MPKRPQSVPPAHSPKTRKAANSGVSFDDMPDSGFMRQPQVLEVVPFSSATMWRKIKKNEFVTPIRLSERVTAFRVGDVRAWLKAQTDACEVA
jgi:predicted DNA-binding transcriptional regulator AlpA